MGRVGSEFRNTGGFEHVQGGRIGVGEPPGWRLQRHDGVTRGIEETAKLLLALPQGHLGALGLGDVLERRHKVVDAAGLISDRRHGKFDPDDGPVFAEIAFVPQMAGQLA